MAQATAEAERKRKAEKEQEEAELNKVEAVISDEEKQNRTWHVSQNDIIFHPQAYLVAYSSHPHTLWYRPRSTRTVPGLQCDWCSHQYNDKKPPPNPPRYSCDKCHYDVCTSCADEVDKRYKLRPTDKRAISAMPDLPIKAEYVGSLCFAFSGGGIRSASFCSGVLRTFIELYGVAPRTISSVSGGGYLASSFLHWSRVHYLAGVPVRQWAPQYFNLFHKHIGYFVRDWFKPLEWSSFLGGVWQLINLIRRVLTWLTTVCLITFSAAFPYAVIISTLLGPAVLPYSSGWTVYAPLLSLALFGLGCIVAHYALKNWIPTMEAWWIDLRGKLRSFIWLLTVALILLLVLLLLSRTSLLVFLTVWGSLLVIVNVLMESTHNMGWNIVLLSAWLCFFYSTVLAWYADRNGEYDEAGLLTRQDQPLRIFGLYDLHYHSFHNVLQSDGTYYSVTGYGLLVTQIAIVAAACVDLLLSFRDMILPTYYRVSLTEAFYYRPKRCKCSQSRRGCCDAYESNQLRGRVERWYEVDGRVTFAQRFLSDFVEFGVIVAVLEATERMLHGVYHLLVNHPWTLLVEATVRGSSGRGEDRQRSQMWGEWCLHKLTRLQTWSTDYRPVATRNALQLDPRQPSVTPLLSDAGAQTEDEKAPTSKRGTNPRPHDVTDWICVTTLNERSQYPDRQHFDQFVLTTEPNDQQIFGQPLSQFGAAVSMRWAALLDGSTDGTVNHPDDAHIMHLEVERNRRSQQSEMGLNDGMALSAAAISFGMGTYASSFSAIRGLRGLHGLLGLSLSKIVQAVPYWSLFWNKGMWPVMLHILHVLMTLFIALRILPRTVDGDSKADTQLWWMCVLFGVVVLIELFVITMAHSDGVELVPIYRAARQLIGVARIPLKDDNPGTLNLTDGGHTENFGLLPLLAKREKLIVLCDGGADKEQQMTDLITVLSECRQVWSIRFRVMDGGFDEHLLRSPYDDFDLTRDIHRWADRRPVSDAHRQHVLKIHIDYPETAAVNGHKALPASQGLLLYLKPREHVALDDTSRSLYGVCCACCHHTACCCGWRYLCGEFPHHSTANQFFTPEMQEDYAKEGESAMRAAERWLRIWQTRVDIRAKLDRCQINKSRWFGVEEHGTEVNDLTRVSVRAAINRVVIVWKHDRQGRDFHISGLQLGYRTDHNEDTTCTHGSVELTEKERKDGWVSEPTDPLILNAHQHIVAVHIRAGTRAVDDLRFEVNDQKQPEQWCRPERASYVDELPEDREENVVAFHGKCLYRVRSRKWEMPVENPITSLSFSFALVDEVGAP